MRTMSNRVNQNFADEELFNFLNRFGCYKFNKCFFETRVLKTKENKE